MSAADDVKEAFSGKRGKILILGGGAAIIAYVWYTRSNGTPQEPVTEDDLVPEVVDSGRIPQTDPIVGNTTTTGVKTRPTTNAEWLSDGTDFLVGRGTSAGTAYNVLNKALGGEPTTAQEQALISQVIAGIGSPPEGMAPLNSTTPTASVGAAAAPHIHHITTTRTSATIKWNPAKNAKSYKIYKTSGQVVVASTTGTQYTVTGLKPNTLYQFSMAGINAAGKRSAGLSNAVAVRTKK